MIRPGGSSDAVGRWARAALVAVSVAITVVPFLVVEDFPAGDLNSHLYNAWLTVLAQEGRIPGIEVHPRWTNGLADALLEALIRRASPRATLAVTQVITAQAFLWSAFLFARALSRRKCWEWLPILACVSIGWTFHTGLTNWELSVSLSLAAAALALREPMRASTVLLATLVLGIASRGNPLPPVWAVAVVLLILGARRGVAAPGLLTAVAIAAVGVVGLAAEWAGIGEHLRWQVAAWTGADQLYIYDHKYRVFSFAVAALWLVAIAPWLWRERLATLKHPGIQVAVFTSACCLLLPDNVWFPGYAIPMTLIGQRSSMLAAIAWTAVAAIALAGRGTRRVAAATSLLALAWVLTLSQDWSRISAAEKDAEAALTALPCAPRAVAVLTAPPSRIDPFSCFVERACVGRCFAWGDYEPSTSALQLHALPGNAYVVSEIADYIAIENKNYVVPALPFPLWEVQACEAPGGTATVCVTQAKTGERLHAQCVDPFWGSPPRAGCPHLLTRG